MSYSIDTKTRVIAFVSDGRSISEASRHFRVNRNTIADWIRNRPHSTRQRARRCSFELGELERMVKAKGDVLTMEDLAQEFRVSKSTIHQHLKKMGLRISRSKLPAVARIKELEAIVARQTRWIEDLVRSSQGEFVRVDDATKANLSEEAIAAPSGDILLPREMPQSHFTPLEHQTGSLAREHGLAPLTRTLEVRR
jgi:AraC-like DNA-binding protein